jgi:hypothetical protein
VLWREFLDPQSKSSAALFDSPFVERWADGDWLPSNDDEKVAAKLHVQMISRSAAWHTLAANQPSESSGAPCSNDGEKIAC